MTNSGYTRFGSRGFARALFLLASAFLLLAGGCAPRTAAVAPARAGYVPEVSRSEWISMLRQRAEAWDAFQANLRIRAEGPKGKNRFQAFAVARVPGHFRLEATNPFGQTVGVLVMNPRETTLWIPSESAVFTAADAQTLIDYFLGITIPPEVFEYGLFAGVPLNHLNADFQVSSSLPGRYTAFSRDPKTGLRFVWEFSSNPMALNMISILGGGDDITVRYEPKVELEPVQNIPEKITFTSSRWQMEVTPVQLERALALEDSSFFPPSAEGIRRVNLDGEPR